MYMLIDYIHLTELPKGPWGQPPRVPAITDPDYIKHVDCDGARFHVFTFAGRVDPVTGEMTSTKSCSEPKCIVNKAGY
jgi:hypothetical protein